MASFDEDCRRAVDLQLLYVRKQLDVAQDAENQLKASCAQAVVLQLRLGINAYLREITEANLSGGLEYSWLDALDLPNADFRLQELKLLAKNSGEWLSKLNFLFRSLLNLQAIPPTEHILDSVVIARTGSATALSSPTVSELENIYLAFKALVLQQRELASEH